MKELRICEVRAEAPAGAGLMICGTPIVYEQPTTINGPAGPFTEVIRRGALDGADLSDVRLMYNHDASRVPLARPPKTMQLSVSRQGLKWRRRCPTPRTPEACIRQYRAAIFPACLSPSRFRGRRPVRRDQAHPRDLQDRKGAGMLHRTIPGVPAGSVEARAAMQEADTQKSAGDHRLQQNHDERG